MNAKRITAIARGLTQLRGGAIYALIACAALASSFYSCSRPPAQQQPTPIAVPDFAQLSSDASLTQTTADKRHACGLQTDGTASRIDGATACHEQISHAKPRRLTLDSNYEIAEGKLAALSIGWRNSCALSPNGQAVCWRQPDIQNLSELYEAFGGVRFEQPLALIPLPNGRFAVVERKGTITVYSDEPNAAPPKTMLDLTDEVICCEDDRGMLNAVLDPQFEEFPFLYVYYNRVSRHAYGENMHGFVGRLARFRIDGGKAVRHSELAILDIPQPNKFHYGSGLRFGADGMLYLATGDNSLRRIDAPSQSLSSLHGKIIRIDVRGATPEQPYRAPTDNPFVDNPEARPEARPEIWAYGLRNPWRMDFAPDGRLFIADVGLDAEEEISLAAAGANLGWPMCEASRCRTNLLTKADAEGLTMPIYTYGKEDGCAVIGGVTAPRLNNGFIFGDYCNGLVWLLEQDRREGWRTRVLAQTERYILSFGIDAATGQVYILTTDKPIMRLQIDGEE